VEDLAGLAEIVGPIGVLVVVVAWALISRRHGNGSSDRYQVVVAKLDGLGTTSGNSRPMSATSAPVWSGTWRTTPTPN